MKIVRKVLILTLNTDWAKELKEQIIESPKIEVEITSTRTAATKLITENAYEAVVIEDTFREKNIDYFLRALSTQKTHPKIIFFFFNEFSMYQKFTVPTELSDVALRAFSLPLPKNILKDFIFQFLFPLGQGSTQFDREFNQVLIKASTRVLETLGVQNLKSNKPELLSKMEKLDVAIRGKVIIKSEFFQGALLISFPLQTYLNICSIVLATEVKELTKEYTDLASEIANMIYGQSKKELDENGVKLNMAIPIVDQSKELKSDNPIYVIPMESSLGKFYIKIAPGLF